MKSPLLDVRKLSIDLPSGGDRLQALSNVDLSLSLNEIVCVVGESGSGKSMLAHAVMGLLPESVRVSGGEIAFGGDNLLALTPSSMRALRGTEITMIFQEPMSALNPLMTIGKQLEEMLLFHKTIPRFERRDRVVAALEAVGLPDVSRMARSYPFQLSGGQRQRAMIAMALMLEPKLLIADEPTTALDVTTQAQILALIARLKEERRMAVLLITHDFGVVADVADRVVVMERGHVVEDGSTKAVLTSPRHAYTQRLMASVPRLSVADSTRRTSGEAVTILDARAISKSYVVTRFARPKSTVAAVADVSLLLRRGRTLAVVGESGSGKSTLGRLLMRLSSPDRGSIMLDGVDLARLRGAPLRVARRRIQMVFQDPYSSLNPRRTVGDQIARGRIAHGASPESALCEAGELLVRVGLDKSAMARFPHQFSGGQRQRIAIARALALKPDVLIADEPVSALDVTVQEQVLSLLEQVQHEFGLAMLFITHDLRIAGRISDDIVVMRKGCIVEAGQTAAVLRAPRHAYTCQLVEAVPGRSWFAHPPVASSDNVPPVVVPH